MLWKIVCNYIIFKNIAKIKSTQVNRGHGYCTTLLSWDPFGSVCMNNTGYSAKECRHKD